MSHAALFACLRRTVRRVLTAWMQSFDERIANYEQESSLTIVDIGGRLQMPNTACLQLP